MPEEDSKEEGASKRGLILKKKHRSNRLLRCLADWTDDEIKEALEKEGRAKELTLFNKFLNVGYKGLQGGNVVVYGEPESEFAQVSHLQREFGRIASDIFYLDKDTWELINAQNKTEA